jgi:hypothetical protein
MDFFIFQSEQDDLCYGFTTDEAGANLPLDLAPWRSPDIAALPQDIQLAVISGSDAIVATIKANGYCVVQADDPKIVRPTFRRR